METIFEIGAVRSIGLVSLRWQLFTSLYLEKEMNYLGSSNFYESSLKPTPPKREHFESAFRLAMSPMRVECPRLNKLFKMIALHFEVHGVSLLKINGRKSLLKCLAALHDMSWGSGEKEDVQGMKFKCLLFYAFKSVPFGSTNTAVLVWSYSIGCMHTIFPLFSSKIM